MIRALIPSLYFNLKYLPLSQAIKLPILLYKPRFVNNSGTIRINGEVKFGMVKLGINTVSIFPNNGIIIENRGHIEFNGTTTVGNNSAITLRKGARLEFGNKFVASTGLRLVCYDSVTFEDNVRIGWNCQIIDTDFHTIKSADTNKEAAKSYGPIRIGHDVWVANGCKLYKNVSIPHSSVVGADTIIHKPIDCAPYSLIVNKREVLVKKSGIFRDMNDDKIKYNDI